MRTCILEVKEDPNLGEIGFALQGLDDERVQFSTDGYLVAHDIMEHLNGAEAIGGSAEELEALGAVWWLRGSLGRFRRDDYSYHSTEDGIAHDIVAVFGDAARGVYWMNDEDPSITLDDLLEKPVPSTRPTGLDVDDLFHQDFTRHLVRSCKNEIEGDIEVSDMLIWHFVNAAEHFMRVGERHARRRYGPGNRLSAHETFMNLAEKITREGKTLYAEGQQFKVGYDIQTATAYCEENHFDEAYW